MKERSLWLANVALFVVASLILATIQTSLWFQVLGYFPPPALWIPGILYLSLHRTPVEAILVTYLICYLLTSMTAMPAGLLMFTGLFLVLVTQFFKQRIYWTSASYFMMVCGLGAMVFHLLHIGGSLMFEDQPLVDPQISDWLIEALLTPLAAPSLYRLFSWFDRITDRKQPAEASAQLL